jgi:hypothetical protein
MSNPVKPIYAPKPCVVEAPVYEHIPRGWYATNFVNVDDCVPIYRNAGGGVVEADLTDLPTAIKKSIRHLDQHIAKAETLKKQLMELL